MACTWTGEFTIDPLPGLVMVTVPAYAVELNTRKMRAKCDEIAVLSLVECVIPAGQEEKGLEARIIHSILPQRETARNKMLLVYPGVVLVSNHFPLNPVRGPGLPERLFLTLRNWPRVRHRTCSAAHCLFGIPLSSGLRRNKVETYRSP